jgi:hypothetical protein
MSSGVSRSEPLGTDEPTNARGAPLGKVLTHMTMSLDVCDSKIAKALSAPQNWRERRSEKGAAKAA